MRKSSAILFGLLMFASGLILGYVISPAKNGSFGCNNGNTENYFYGKSEELSELEKLDGTEEID